MFMLTTVKSGNDGQGIRQLLDKKTGILRQKMMGKRVNHSCRTVISPDPFLAVNEISIPPVAALVKKLTCLCLWSDYTRNIHQAFYFIVVDSCVLF
jgi:DNA-directed RNA polymerase beta' subunit